MRQPVRVEGGSTSVEVRTPAAHVPTIASGSAAVLVGASMLAGLRPVNAFTVVLGLGAVVMGMWIAVSAARARVMLTDDQLEQHGDLRRKLVPTDQISEFYVDRTPHLVPWISVWVRLRSGEELPLEQCRVFGFTRGDAHQRLQHAVDSLNDRLASR